MGEAMIVQTEGIVLKSFNIRETSRIVTFFTKDFGKVKGILKGIRKDPKKFGSNVDNFSVNGIVYYQYRRSDIHLVSQCDLKDYFFPIRKDLKRSLAASYMLELVAAILPSEEPNGEVYQLMLDFLNTLSKQEDINKLVHIFQIKILVLSGFKPHIDSCLRCQKTIKGRVRFSLQLGGLICWECPLDDPQARLVSQGTIASLLHIEHNDWHKSLRLGLTPTVKQELKGILNEFLVFHLERHLKSTKYLATI